MKNIQKLHEAFKELLYDDPKRFSVSEEILLRFECTKEEAQEEIHIFQINSHHMLEKMLSSMKVVTRILGKQALLSAQFKFYDNTLLKENASDDPQMLPAKRIELEERKKLCSEELDKLSSVINQDLPTFNKIVKSLMKDFTVIVSFFQLRIYFLFYGLTKGLVNVTRPDALSVQSIVSAFSQQHRYVEEQLSQVFHLGKGASISKVKQITWK